MKILVTGGAGFIGSHLCEALIRKGHRVVALDNFDTFYDPQIKERNISALLAAPAFELVRGDILDQRLLSKLFSGEHFDVVVHLAARAGVRPSIVQPLLYARVNVEGTVGILEAMKTHGVKKLVFASSSSVYGNNMKVPYSEGDPIDHTISPYAATKKACEAMVHTYCGLYGFDAFCLRFFTAYGPRQRPEMAIHNFARCISEGRSIVVYGDGTSSRDYTYIDDIVDGILRSIEQVVGFEIFNLGESRTTSLSELVSLIEQTLGKKARIERLPMQPGDVSHTFADISKARSRLGYNPVVSVEEGIRRFVEWFRATP